MAAALTLSRFDSNLREEWTKHFKTSTELPTPEDIEEFLEPLENNLQSLFLGGRPSSKNTPSRRPASQASPKNNQSVCVLCKEPHRLFRCPVFLGYDPPRRHRYVKERKGCTNCLSTNHQVHQCPSSFTCRECNCKHNTLLHRPNTHKQSTPINNYHTHIQTLIIFIPIQTTEFCLILFPYNVVLVFCSFVTE